MSHFGWCLDILIFSWHQNKLAWRSLLGLGGDIVKGSAHLEDARGHHAPSIVYRKFNLQNIFRYYKKRYKLYGVIPIPFNCSNKKFPMFFSKDFACPTAVSCLLMGGDAARHASPVSKGALDSPGRRWWFLEQAFSRAGWMECSARMECLSTLHGVLSLEGWSLILRYELALI